MMPVYCYRNKEHVIERTFRAGAAPKSVMEDGRRFARSIPDEWKDRVPANAGGWPLWSDALGVHPSQIPERMEFDRQMGVPTEYHPETGQAKLENMPHRAARLKVHNLYDRNGGYGDG